MRQGPRRGAGHWPPWPGPAPAPAGSGGLVLRLDRKTNEFHYGIAILFHVSGSLRLTCSPGCDRPRHPRARAPARGFAHLLGTELLRPCHAHPGQAGLCSPTLIPAGALQHLGGGKDQGQGSGTATVLSHVLKVLRPPKDSSCRQARAKHDPSTALGGHVLPNNRLGGREEVGHGGLGTLTIADDTGDLARPMGCSYPSSARWLPTLGGHGGCAVVLGLCCAVPCCAVLCRAVPGLAALPSPPPLRGRRQLALFAGGFAHSSSWVTRLRNLSGDRGSWEP